MRQDVLMDARGRSAASPASALASGEEGSAEYDRNRFLPLDARIRAATLVYFRPTKTAAILTASSR